MGDTSIGSSLEVTEMYYYCAPVQWLLWPLIIESRTTCIELMYAGSLFNYLLSMCLAISPKKMESYVFKW